MKLIHTELLRKNKSYILENVKQAKMYVAQEKLSTEDLKELIELDPTPTRKFVGWMAKQWINKNVIDIDDLRNTVEEYNVFLNKGKAKTKDINQFKTFEDLKKEVEEVNNTGEGVSAKDLEDDYDVVMDNEDLYIASPHTHEASRKLGLSKFAHRKCSDGEDSAWCTTFKTSDHFNDYYYRNNVTFYYIKVKSSKLINKLKEVFPQRYRQLETVALAVLNDGTIDGYDGLDKQIKGADIKKLTQILGIS